MTEEEKSENISKSSPKEVVGQESTIKALLHKQEILEKNFRSQLRDEIKRKKGLVDDLRKAEKKIKDLGKIISEKDKIINRLHIYSRGRKLPTLKPKEFSSTPSNLDGVGIEEEDVVERLDKKLKDLEMKRMKVLLEKVESPPDALGPDIGHSSGTDVSSSVRHLSSNNKVMKLEPVERKFQEDVDRKVVISNIQEKLPKISKQNGNVASDKEEGEQKEINEEKNKEGSKNEEKDQEEEQEKKHDDETTESSGDSNEEQRSSKTPDLVPKSFQDKRSFFENLGPIKVKKKGKKTRRCEDRPTSPEEKIKFWLPATPPSVRQDDIFVGKKFDKPPKQVTFSDQNNIY